MAILEISAPNIGDNGDSDTYSLWGQLHLHGVPDYDHRHKRIMPAAWGNWTWYPNYTVMHDDFWGHCKRNDLSGRCNKDTAQGRWDFEHGMQFTLWAHYPEYRFAMFLTGLMPLHIAHGFTGIGYLQLGTSYVGDKEGKVKKIEGDSHKFRWTVFTA